MCGSDVGKEGRVFGLGPLDGLRVLNGVARAEGAALHDAEPTLRVGLVFDLQNSDKFWRSYDDNYDSKLWDPYELYSR